MSALVDTARRGRALRRRDLAVGLLLTGTSGAGLLSHVVGPVPLSYSAPFVVLPSAAILAGVLLAGCGRIAAVGLLADRLIAGLWWGLVATAAYDGVRPLVVATFRFSVNPFLAMPPRLPQRAQRHGRRRSGHRAVRRRFHAREGEARHPHLLHRRTSGAGPGRRPRGAPQGRPRRLRGLLRR